MKVYFKKRLGGMTGTVDGGIYYYHPKLDVCLMRPYKYPRLTVNNERIKAIMQNLKTLSPSKGYKNNLADYIIAYNKSKDFQHKTMTTWSNAWLKLMFAMQKAMPQSIDLASITPQQIMDENLPCKTVKDAIEAGLLPALPDYERWDKEI